MSSVNYKTIRLSRGTHSSPEEGACVMELASMLARESFTDRPASVSPVIGSLLRAYNDSIDHDRRQDLYAYASKIVGSHDSSAVERERADHLAQWAERYWQRRWPRSVLPARLRLIGVERRPPIDVLGNHAVRAISKPTDETHAAVLALVDELLAIGTPGHRGSAGSPRAQADAPRRDGLTGVISGAHLW